MRSIWNVVFMLHDHAFVEIPEGSTWLPLFEVDNDHGTARVWFDVPDTEALPESRLLVVTGTGHPVPDEKQYRTTHIASTIVPPFAWHLFEMRPVR